MIAALVTCIARRCGHDVRVSKVDERAPVAPLDAVARGRLARALQRPEVVSALLFGSQASGRAGRLSDVDVALWLDPAVEPERHGELALELTGVAADALRTGEVQVVVLNRAPPALAHRAIRDGVRLFDRDPRARIRLEARALLDYLDTAPLRAAMRSGLVHLIEEGRYGRP
jgi:predicted nucleotidyltransferase